MILIIGSSHPNTANFYKKLGLEQSKLIASVNEYYSIGHTSPQDMITYENLTRLAKTADQIYFSYPTPEEFSENYFYYEFLDWLKEFNFKYKKIINLKNNIIVDAFNWNLKPPELNKNDAVFIGCSFTEGIGIECNEDKYATIVAKHFNLNCVNLGKGGSSNSYFFEIFSQLEFHPGQLIVLQLTILERLRYYNNNVSLQHIQFANPLYSPKILEVYNNKFLFYETLKQLRLVNQIAEAKNLKLAVWLNNYKEEHHGHYTMDQQMYFYNLKSFVPAFLMQDYCVDVGTDNVHPGIKSNQNIANVLIDFIEKTYNNEI